MKRKLFVTLMSGGLMVSLLAACGEKEDVAPKNDNNTAIETTTESKADASEDAASVSTVGSAVEVDSDETEKASSDMTTVADGGAVGSAVAVDSGERDIPTQVWNGAEEVYIDVELDENNNISNFDEIVTTYRNKIAERLNADLTNAKSGITYADIEYIDVDVNSITDDNAWLYENSRTDYQAVDMSARMPELMFKPLEFAVYDKFYLAAVYKILDNYDVSKDAITAFESHGISNGDYANVFDCSIDSDKITEIGGGQIGELGDGYLEIYFEVRRADGGLTDYVSIVPGVFRID